MLFHSRVGAHDERMLVEIPYIFAVGEFGDGMSHGHYFRPGGRRSCEIVVAGFRNKCTIS